jgi:hypothetical protein
MKRLVLWLTALASLLLAGACFAHAAEVVDLPTRPGVTQRMLVLQPQQPVAVLVLMTGGSGHLGIFDNGSLRNDGNFLVRSRALFVQHGDAAIRWARQRFGLPVWLVGTSRGTQSVAYAGTVLSGASAPDGLVLTSTILGSSRLGQSTARPVQEMALDQLQVPMLVTHHEQDQCQVCPPALLPALMARLAPGRSQLITYQGGRSVGNFCEAFAHHGYNGIEDRVVADIAAWIAARPK